LKRILIIDDVRDRAAWLKASLELAGFDVVGVLAWEQVSEHSIQGALADVIIVDADAPGRDTLEQISLMSTRLEKPVVVLSGQNDQQSIQEAMRAGVAVIGSNRGGVPEIIDHEDTGLLFESFDIDSLYAAIKRLYLEPEFKQQLATQGKRKADKVFNTEQHFRMLEQHLKNITDSANN
jgi:glycosyltransferase involved in cell wall biosynthesis